MLISIFSCVPANPSGIDNLFCFKKYAVSVILFQTVQQAVNILRGKLNFMRKAVRGQLTIWIQFASSIKKGCGTFELVHSQVL